jgi:hypothetical protein
MPVTDPCACKRGPNCIRRSTTTRDEALGDPCPSWSARSSWSRSSGCLAAKGGASLESCGCGGMGRRGQRRTSISSGAYVRRFDLEHTLRFLKQHMGWTTPRVRHPEQADRWSWLVLAVYTQLRLARARVADLRLPWERRYDAGRLTPVRVHRVVSSLLEELGTPAKAPKPCGRSPGRPKGRLSGLAKRYPAIKKAA